VVRSYWESSVVGPKSSSLQSMRGQLVWHSAEANKRAKELAEMCQNKVREKALMEYLQMGGGSGGGGDGGSSSRSSSSSSSSSATTTERAVGMAEVVLAKAAIHRGKLLGRGALAVWLQAGEDRAIAAGSRAD
jgi:hypothetical protein